MTPVTPVLAEDFQPKEIVYAKDQPQYTPIPVLRNSQGVVLSRWELSDREREAIANGADIFMSNCTFNQPLQPVRLEVGQCDRDFMEMAKVMELVEPSIIDDLNEIDKILALESE